MCACACVPGEEPKRENGRQKNVLGQGGAQTLRGRWGAEPLLLRCVRGASRGRGERRVGPRGEAVGAMGSRKLSSGCSTCA